MNFNTILLFLGNLGPTEILFILFIILLFFGAKKIPELARGLGRGMREFKDATREVHKNLEEGLRDEDPKQLNKPKE
ncbi:MAG TPA: twin-arginine translocase TatA/TatE family subunit [Microscillaceae bacterium]|jgi:sec-independent protein translocase protein TatA|nr:twin-arginine translocase TatA/TatE family subunit [Microscillaceae bacterium]